MRAIDADALIRELTTIKVTFGSRNGLVEGGLGIAISKVHNMPTIEPERKKGNWEVIDSADGGTDFRCSSCHRYRFHNGEMRKKYKFCPNCGADMMEEGDSE